MEALGDSWFGILLIVLAAGLLIYILWPSHKIPPVQESPWSEEQKPGFKLLQADLLFDDLRFNATLGDCSDNWKKRMAEYGRRISGSGVKTVLLVNGTYAGSDPMDLIPLTKSIFPQTPASVEKALEWVQRKSLDKLVKDCGNFLEDYRMLLELGLQSGIRCYNFKWSSGNHHAARLQGAINLVNYLGELMKDGRIPAHSRLLMIGHSHAGQVFSLITQMFDRRIREKLLEVAKLLEFDPKQTLRSLKDLELLSFDFVTLGMPPRYSWYLNERMQLLHLINHRGGSHKAGSFRGILHTLDGDYVQQAGIRGTDTINIVPKLRMANLKLNDILDGGTSVRRWLEDIKLKNRIPRFGYSYLIDYQDNSYGKPNLFRTIFGHGTYTETRFMEFNMRIITEHFYR